MRDAISSTVPSASEEWRTNWLLVLSAMVGLSLGTVPSATLGLFMEPLQREFGWSRTEISAGLTIFALVSLPLTPFAGVLVDKFGARRVAIPGVALSAAVFASFSLLGGSLILWLSIWFLYTLVSLLTRTLVWNSAVSSAFQVSRGLAIAFVLCGTAIATTFSPLVSQWLIADFGWRTAYLGLGLAWGGTALILVALFFRDVRQLSGTDKQARMTSNVSRPGGLTVREAIRSAAMIRIAIATFLQSTMAVAVMVHLVPMLTARGLSRPEAAGVAALLGVASIAGKLLTGWLIDRLSSRLIPAITFALPALGYVLLLRGSETAWLMPVGVLVLGYCSGAALQLTTYLTTRHAGMRNFGTIFGIISSLMALATGVGPVVAGAVFDATGSYSLLLTGGIIAALIAGFAMLRLGSYPNFDADAPRSSVA